MNLLNSDVYKQATQISKKYATHFGKSGACHNLFNAKLIYSPIMLQELSKFYYRTISEKMMVLRIWNFQEWLEMEQKYVLRNMYWICAQPLVISEYRIRYFNEHMWLIASLYLSVPLIARWNTCLFHKWLLNVCFFCFLFFRAKNSLRQGYTVKPFFQGIS